MWVIRILNGPQKGQFFPIRKGKNLVGRAPDCHVKLSSKSVSKQHCEIELIDDKAIISDLESRNGTFVNGVQKKRHNLKTKDQIKLHDIEFEVLEISDKYQVYFQNHKPGSPGLDPQAQAQSHGQQQAQYQPEHYNQQVAYDQYPQGQAHPVGAHQAMEEPVPTGVEGMVHLAKNYIEDVILPGVYKLPEWMSFNWVLALFMGGYILLVTSLSAIPLIQIFKSSIELESRTKAQAIARAMAEINRADIQENILSGLKTRYATDQAGVRQAYIVRPDGTIMAPPAKADRQLEIPYFHTAKTLAEPEPDQVDSDTIVAVVPIRYTNSQTGEIQTGAFSVIEYDMNNLAVTDKRVLSLLIRVFLIAMVVGSVLFFFLFKLIEFPFKKVNAQVDEALRKGTQDVHLEFEFPPLQNLISNINSALSRMSSGGEQVMNIEYDRNPEMNNIVQLIGYAAITVSAHDKTIITVNPLFEERTGLSKSDLINKPIDAINDQALKLSIVDLLDRLSRQPEQLVSNELEFAGLNYEVAAQSIYGNKNAAYYIVALLPLDNAGGL